jgi:glycosyltransferase involved in cell wall biosynthesis
MMPDHNSSSSRPINKKISYIIGAFPNLTTTFITREVLEAQRQGVTLVIISIRPRPAFQMDPPVKRLAAVTKYLLPVPWLEFLKVNVYFGLSRFRVYFLTLAYLLTRRHDTLLARLKTLLHFGEGVWAAALLRSEGVDHLHAHFADRAAIVALVAARLLGVPYSLTAHANDIYVSPALLPEKISNAKFVTTCTGYNKAYLERVTGHHVELVYHGLDLAGVKQTPRPSPNGHPPLILAVGQLKEKKGFPYLIKACQRLKSKGYAFTCEIIGEGPNREELEALIVDLKLQDKIILRGALPNAVVMSRYSKATLFSLPCVVAKNDDRDGIPNVLLEAMANQVAVVSTRVSGIPEVVKDEVTGLLVEPGDDQALATAIACLLDDAELRTRLAQAGYRFVVENFDIRKNIGRLVRLLEL